jgi:hypothetical protein
VLRRVAATDISLDTFQGRCPWLNCGRTFGACQRSNLATKVLQIVFPFCNPGVYCSQTPDADLLVSSGSLALLRGFVDRTVPDDFDSWSGRSDEPGRQDDL